MKKIDKGKKLYKKAKKIIPGGNMFLSKRPEMYLPENWPSYYSKAKGNKVWDLDGNEFIDMSVMGVGTNILGYSNDEVDNYVKKKLTYGNMSTLNCPEEVYLSEKLIELHPWADMVRLCRTGGEANAVAIRIARAFTGKDKIAICGYHGWHDWYLSTNFNTKDGLSQHLLPGLKPNGVPKSLSNTTFPFIYNDIDSITNVIKENKDIGIVKMEVSRSEEPNIGYLEYIRNLCNKKNIVLIFDECTSGFRETFGGLHKKYNVYPDIAIFGKALGNGYAISSIIGKSIIMESSQKTFISSTFWTERIGPSAALATLKVMEREKSWNKITSIGKNIRKQWKFLANKYDLKIKIFGLPSLSSFTIESIKWLEYKTYITQEMLKKGILATNSIYVCIAHDEKSINKYFIELEKIFKKIRSFEDGDDVVSNLDGPICHAGFKRLN